MKFAADYVLTRSQYTRALRIMSKVTGVPWTKTSYPLFSHLAMQELFIRGVAVNEPAAMHFAATKCKELMHEGPMGCWLWSAEAIDALVAWAIESDWLNQEANDRRAAGVTAEDLLCSREYQLAYPHEVN